MLNDLKNLYLKIGMIYKVIDNNQLYVYMNGTLLYKRWFKYDYGMIFCPIFKAFTCSDELKSK